MGVPLLDLKAQYATIRHEIETAMREVCEAQSFIMGPAVTAFEKSVAAYCKVEHAIGVSSGSDALLIALMALGALPDAFDCRFLISQLVPPKYTFLITARYFT